MNNSTIISTIFLLLVAGWLSSCNEIIEDDTQSFELSYINNSSYLIGIQKWKDGNYDYFQLKKSEKLTVSFDIGYTNGCYINNVKADYLGQAGYCGLVEADTLKVIYGGVKTFTFYGEDAIGSDEKKHIMRPTTYEKTTGRADVNSIYRFTDDDLL